MNPQSDRDMLENEFIASASSELATLRQENELLKQEVEVLKSMLPFGNVKLKKTLNDHFSMVNHYTVLVKDLEASKEFYENMIGCIPTKRPAEILGKGLWYSIGNAELHLIEYPTITITQSLEDIKCKSDDGHRGLINHKSPTDIKCKSDDSHRGLINHKSPTDFKCKSDDSHRGLINHKSPTDFKCKSDDSHRGLVNHICFDCDSILEAEKKLRCLNIQYEKETFTHTSACGVFRCTQIWFKDPDGHVTEFIHRERM